MARCSEIGAVVVNRDRGKATPFAAAGTRTGRCPTAAARGRTARGGQSSFKCGEDAVELSHGR